MSPRTTTKPPTEQEIEQAMDVISQAAKARNASGPTAAQRAFHKFSQQRRALAAECDETAESFYWQILNVLPEDYKELFRQYGLLVVAPCSITQHNLKMFRTINQKAKKLLAQLEQAAKPKSRSAVRGSTSLNASGHETHKRQAPKVVIQPLSGTNASTCRRSGNSPS